MEIIQFADIHAVAFKELNETWISQFFKIEDHDLEQLDNPQEILDGGGEIFFALIEGSVAATVAVIKTGAAEFELAKMAVNPSFQGRGIGKAIGQRALDFARGKGATRVWLESNRKLVTALHVYKLLGFKEVPIDSTPYSRADIRMEVWL